MDGCAICKCSRPFKLMDYFLVYHTKANFGDKPSIMCNYYFCFGEVPSLIA